MCGVVKNCELNTFSLGVCKYLASTVYLDIVMNVHLFEQDICKEFYIENVLHVCSTQKVKTEYGVFYTRKGIWKNGI